ncbi:MAG: molybdopterin-dependent oxidoreductase [Pirellulales bacterium]|nr:molybdopterin-dependent oxidoreductase [Pirellulales bacterium]
MHFLISQLVSIATLLAVNSPPVSERQIVLTVQVKSLKPITFTADELDKLERMKLPTGNGNAQRTFEGVPLAKILEAAGVAWGTECSGWTDCYVVVRAADEYRAVFAIPEIAPQLARKTILLADRCDGKPLPEAVGPYQVVEEDARQHGRWVRQVTTIQIRVASE